MLSEHEERPAEIDLLPVSYGRGSHPGSAPSLERDQDQPYERASEDPPARRASTRDTSRSRMREEIEPELRRLAENAGDARQIAWLDHLQKRREERSE